MNRLFPKVRSLARVVTQALHIYEPLYRIHGYMLSRKKQQIFDQEFNALYQEICAAASPKQAGKQRIIVTGILQTEKKPTLFRFFEAISRELRDTELIFLDEQAKPIETERHSHHYIPRAIRAAGYEPHLPFHLSRQEKCCIAMDPEIQKAAEFLYARQQDMTLSYAKALAYRYDQIYRVAIEVYQPDAVIIWSEFPALHMLCRHICREYGVIPVYMEYGSLPGTFSLDARGQMGESWIAQDYQSFRQLPVEQHQMEHASRVLSYLRDSQLNRNKQETSTAELEKLQKRLTAGKPIVLFAGQNDFDSGLLPYDSAAKQNHSPLFADSMEALAYLADAADEIGYQLIYKPHPAMAERTVQQAEKLPQNVHVILHTDIHKIIDFSDLVITVVSQTGYVSCIREKATLTLGYNQLRGKGATYEAYSLEQMIPAIQEALRYGMTEEKKKNFLIHTAQMLQYGVYDDLTDRTLRFGQSTECAVRFLSDLIRRS